MQDVTLALVDVGQARSQKKQHRVTPHKLYYILVEPFFSVPSGLGHISLFPDEIALTPPLFHLQLHPVLAKDKTTASR